MILAPAVACLLLSSGAVAAPVEPQEPRSGEQVLASYLNASRRTIVRGASMVAEFAAMLPKLRKSGTLQARRRVSQTGKIEYEVLDSSGDSTIKKEVIARYINADIDLVTYDQTKVNITPDNYRFKYKGMQDKEGRNLHVFELNPRKKRVGLFKGELWVDPATGLTVREAGRLVKSPSVFLKKVEFVRQYEIKNGLAVPVVTQSTLDTRFWGQAMIDVRFSEFTFEPTNDHPEQR